MKKVLEINKLEEPYTNSVIGYPMTPGEWADAPEYKTVTRLTMAIGGVLGNRNWEELTEELNPMYLSERLSNNRMVFINTFDGKRITINPRFIVKAENFTMVTRKFNSRNPNFPKGEYTCRWLLALNETADFANQY